MEDVAVVVIGAGQAGLSSAFHLRRLGYEPGRDFVVLDHAEGPGGAWQYRWPTLTYGKVHGMHSLPGMELEGADPRRRSSEVISEYFAAYERTFALAVRRPVHVRAVREDAAATSDEEPAVTPDTDPAVTPDAAPAAGTAGAGGRGAPWRGLLRVETSAGVWRTRAVINATGTWDRPFWPRFPGQESFRGRQLHTADYPGPDSPAFTGRRVVVVGGGTSAVQHLLEVSEVAAETAWVTRREPLFREGPFTEELGRQAVALVDERVRRGLPPRSVVSVTGLPLTDEMRAARERGVLVRQPMFARLVPEGVEWADGRRMVTDTVLWATGFRPAVGHLAPLGLRGPGGGIRMDGTRVVGEPRVHLVGYGPSASTVGANRAGRAAARAVHRLLTGEAAHGGGSADGERPAGHERGDDPSPEGLTAAHSAPR